MKFFTISLIILAFLLTSCTGQLETLTITPTLVSISPTIRDTAAVKATSTKVPLSATPVIISTPTLVPSLTPPPPSKPVIFQRCLTIQPNISSKENRNGTIIIQDFLPPSAINISLFNLSTDKSLTLPITGGNVIASPNGSYFAFIDFNNDNLEIYSVNGDRIKSVTLEENWGAIERWLDNEHLVIILSEPDSPGSRHSKYPPATLIFNPFNGQKMIMPSDYPYIDTTFTGLPWYPYSSTIYSQGLERVVYLGYVRDKATGKEESIGAILYSIPDKKQLAQIKAINTNHNPPTWSPDGSKFIFMGDDEFYLVSYNGNTSKITHLNPNIIADKPFIDRYSAEYYSWSPDNRHLAFWLIHPGNKQRTFAILDAVTGEVTDYCIKAGYNYQQYMVDPFPVWSPDGKSVIVIANFRPEDQYGSSSPGEGNDVVLIDLEENSVFKISENKYAIGWLVPPE